MYLQSFRQSLTRERLDQQRKCGTIRVILDANDVSGGLQKMCVTGCQGEFEFKYEMQHISHRFSRIAFPKIIFKQLLQKVYDSYKTMEVSNILVIRS